MTLTQLQESMQKVTILKEIEKLLYPRSHYGRIEQQSSLEKIDHIHSYEDVPESRSVGNSNSLLDENNSRGDDISLSGCSKEYEDCCPQNSYPKVCAKLLIPSPSEQAEVNNEKDAPFDSENDSEYYPSLIHIVETANVTSLRHRYNSNVIMDSKNDDKSLLFKENMISRDDDKSELDYVIESELENKEELDAPNQGESIEESELNSLSGSKTKYQVRFHAKSKIVEQTDLEIPSVISVKDMVSDWCSVRRSDFFHFDSTNEDYECNYSQETSNQISLLHELFDALCFKCTIPQTLEDHFVNEVEVEDSGNSRVVSIWESVNEDSTSFSPELKETLERTASRIYAGILIQRSLGSGKTDIPNSSKDIYGINRAMTSELVIGECTRSSFDYDQDEIREVLDKIALRVQTGVGTPVLPILAKRE